MKEAGYIGIDSGGSHSKGILVSSSGQIIAEALAGPCSVSGTPFDIACVNLKTVTSELIAKCPDEIEIRSLYAGISGCGVKEDAARFDEFLSKSFPELQLKRTGSDALNPMYASIGNADGIIAICGTGSGAYAVVNGRMHRIDLDGYLFGDEAGGYVIGRNVLNHALKMQDGRIGKTMLYDLCEEQIGGNVRENLQRFYQGGKQMVASLAPIAFRAMELGDHFGKRIIDEAIGSITECILAASRHFPAKKESITVVICGSLWQPANRYFVRKVSELTGPGFKLMEPALLPEIGAAIYAASLDGIKDTNGLIQKLIKNRGS